MPPFSKVPPGYNGLMERMARELGLEIARDSNKLGLSPADVARLKRRCAACSEPDDCRHKLAVSRQQDLPPTYCPNRKTLFYLASLMSKGGGEG